MGGVYGDFLAFFPELMQDFTIVSVKARIGAGYDISPVGRTVRGVIQTVRESNENAGSRIRHGDQAFLVESDSDIWVLYTYEAVRVGRDALQWRGHLYRPSEESVWVHEGGFYQTRLERVVGCDGSQTTDVAGGITQGVFR